MPILEWDKVGSKVYETGLDRGVLYMPDGSAVPWNGLTSIIETFNKSTSPVYFDGMKITDLVTLGDFSATMKAVTYPEEFVEIEGSTKLRNGLFVGDQPPQTFCLCYRTKIGNDLDVEAGYKLHLIYNLTAIPSDKTYNGIKDSMSLTEFEWKITAVPEDIPGFRPTAHITINSIDLDPWLLEDLESILYGDQDQYAQLIPMPEFINFINSWVRVKIIDNGDGTWTATSSRDGFIDLPFQDVFEIINVNSFYIDENTFNISDTVDVTQTPLIKINDNGDGTWSASTDNDLLININSDGSFNIYEATVDTLGLDAYSISDTPGS